MSVVLTTSSKITCGHEGAVIIEGTAKLTLNGGRQRGGSDILPIKNALSGKVNTATCIASPPQARCTTILTVTAGSAMKLKVGGNAVILKTLAGTTDKGGTLIVSNIPASPKAKLTAI